MGKKNPLFRKFLVFKCRQYLKLAHNHFTNVEIDQDAENERCQTALQLLNHSQKILTTFYHPQTLKTFFTMNSHLLITTAGILRASGSLNSSTKVLMKAYQLEKKNLGDGQLMTLLNLGGNIIKQNKSVKALKYCKMAVDQIQESTKKKEVAACYYNLALVYKNLGNRLLTKKTALKGIKEIRDEEFQEKNMFMVKFDNLMNKKNPTQQQQQQQNSKNKKIEKSENPKFYLPSNSSRFNHSKSKSNSMKKSLQKRPLFSYERVSNRVKGLLKSKIGLSEQTGISLYTRDFNVLRNTVFYTCDEYSTERDKRQMPGKIIFGKPVKMLRKVYSPYGDIKEAEKDIRRSMKVNSFRIRRGDKRSQSKGSKSRYLSEDF